MPCLLVKQTDDKKIKRPVPTHNSLPLNKEIAGSKRPILLKRKLFWEKEPGNRWKIIKPDALEISLIYLILYIYNKKF